MSTDDDVVVTGLGATTPLGGDVATFWAGLLAGRSGVSGADRGLGRAICRSGSRRRWRVDPAEVLPPGPGPPAGPQRAGRARRRPRGLGRRRLRRHGRRGRLDPTRVAVVIGTGIGGVTTLLDQYDMLQEKGPAAGLAAARSR